MIFQSMALKKKRIHMNMVLIVSLVLVCPMSWAGDVSKEEAVVIAEKVWKEKFTQADGYPNMDIYKPYALISTDEYWRVTGTRPYDMIGGVPVIEIRKSDVYILNVFHTK